MASQRAPHEDDEDELHHLRYGRKAEGPSINASSPYKQNKAGEIAKMQDDGIEYEAYFVQEEIAHRKDGRQQEQVDTTADRDKYDADAPTAFDVVKGKITKERAVLEMEPAHLDHDEEEEEEKKAVEEPDPYLIPMSHEAVLEKHNKTVSALAVDTKGARVISGSMDGKVHIYDFEGMKKDMKSFRKIEPQEGHQVIGLSWSPTSDCFLSIPSSAQAKLYDRDGRELGEFDRGDMYIRDLRSTKGHIAGITGGHWHPVDKESCLTCSEDGTLRLWDTNNVIQKAVMKPQQAKPGRLAVSSCCYNADGRIIAAGMMDGTIQLWSSTAKASQQGVAGNVPAYQVQRLEKQKWTYVSRPGQLVRSAHEAMTDITNVCFSEDGNTLISRGGDETLKVWDLRKFKKPLKEFTNLPCLYATTQCTFSPDGQLIITGTSADKGGQGGGLVFFDKSSLEVVRKIGYAGSVTCMQWHESLNQLFVGMGDRTFGETRILYDPELSTKGALVCVGRSLRVRDPLNLNVKAAIYNPNALPMYKDTWSKKRSRDKELKDPVKTKRPDPGNSVVGRGRAGKLGETGGTILTQHLLKTQGLLKAQWDDPREALLKHDSKDSWYTRAYKDTQPEPQFAKEDEEEKGKEEVPRKVDPHTGMYISDSER